MPFEWNNILVVTKEELVPNFWNTLGSLQKEIKRYEKKPYGITRVQKGGNGRQLLISFDSLPTEYQLVLGDPRKLNHPMEAFYKVDSKAVQYYTSFQFPDGSYIIPETQEQYIINASVCNALLELKQARITERLTKGGSVRGIMATLCTDAITFNEVLKSKHDVQHNLPSHPRTFAEKLNEYDKVSYVALVKDAQQKTKANARKVDEATIKLLNDLFAKQEHKPTSIEVSRQYESFLSGYIEVVNPLTGEQYSPKGFKSISDSTVKGYLKMWENRLGTYAHRSGNRQTLMQEFNPYHSLEQPTMAGSLISIDDRQPPFWYDKGKRVWFYMGVDVASEAVICWVHGKSKEGIIIEFYRQLVRQYNEWNLPIPAGLECEMSLNSSFKDTFLREGAMFDHVKMEANKARGKVIENYFRRMRYGDEKKREGWIARPNARAESNQAGSDKPNKILAYDNIVKGCLHDIEKWNNTKHSSSNESHTISRWDYFLQNQNPDVKPTNYRSFLPHIGRYQKSSCHAGIIKLQYGEYLLGDDDKVSLGEHLIYFMRQVEGKDIDIFWLDDNDGQVIKALIYLHGRYVCEAVPKPTYNRAKAEWTDRDIKAREIMSAYDATITAFQKSQYQNIEPVLVIEKKNESIVGNSFQIKGLKRYEEPESDTVEILEEFKEEAEWEEEMQNTGTGGFTWRKNFEI